MQDVQLPGQNASGSASFTVTNSTLAKILLDVWAPQVMAAIDSETAIPGEDGVRQRVFTGGQRVVDGCIASTDSAAKDVLIYIGRQTSLYASMGTVSISSQNIINRSTGSFITDGYLIGDVVMPFGSANSANNGVFGIVTGVTATQLTVNGTPWTNVTEGAGFRVFRVSQRTRRTVAANAGNTTGNTVPPVQLIGGTQDPSVPAQPDTGWLLGPADAVIVALTAAASALPARIDVQAQSVRY